MKKVCEGRTGDQQTYVWAGWKQTTYSMADLSRNIGNNILSINRLSTGRYDCKQDLEFPLTDNLIKLRAEARDCILTVNNSDEKYSFSILYLYPSTEGISQWIVVVAVQPGERYQETIKKNLRLVASQIQ